MARTVDEHGARTWVSPMQVAGLASIGAGAVHAAAIGIHAEHATLSRLFVAVAVAQISIGIVALVRGGRVTAATAFAVNAGAVVAWAVTRMWGISWINGLEQSEAPQFADSVCAGLGTVAATAALIGLARGRSSVPAVRLGVPAAGIGALTVVAMMFGAGHVHSGGSHSHDDEASAGPAAAGGAAAEGAAADVTAHAHDDQDEASDTAHAHEPDDTSHDEVAAAPVEADATATTAHAHDEGNADADTVAAVAWPRPYDPADPIDYSGVPGVTADQQARAEALVERTQAELPAFGDVATLPALGYRSIGDAGTGYEHYINTDLINDDKFLDPTAPESLVYRVEGDARTLVSAMFIATSTPIDDPELVGYGGPLMQWHVHTNLCWALDAEGEPKVVAVTDDHGGVCPPGSVNAGGDSPMVHVWIAPHECGPFAALEGHGAGQADTAAGQRTDQCAHGDHSANGDTAEEAAAVPYDPTKPIDLSGLDGVTVAQQAYAENVVAENILRLPQWSDPAVAEAAGYHSIGDAATGHEHYINWDTIDDDVWLDPDAPESLVYEPQSDGSKKLVSAMYMLPTTMPLADVPDFGGQLMQWHIHDNLCFSLDPEAPVVAGLTDGDGNCPATLQKFAPAPMIHVWITPHPCGPFAALEGVGAGQVLEGQEHFCNEAHGSH